MEAASSAWATWASTECPSRSASYNCTQQRPLYRLSPWLPIYLDAGTNNESLLHDPFYLGLRRPRPTAKELDAFVDQFVAAVQEVFPRCCIHFEDWTGIDAINLLARYRDTACSYNLDIQALQALPLPDC